MRQQKHLKSNRMNKAKRLFHNVLFISVLRHFYAANRLFVCIFLCFNSLCLCAVADSQAEGRGFEPRYPLNLKAVKITYLHGFLQRFFVAKSFVFNIEGCTKNGANSPKKQHFRKFLRKFYEARRKPCFAGLLFNQKINVTQNAINQTNSV